MKSRSELSNFYGIQEGSGPEDLTPPTLRPTDMQQQRRRRPQGPHPWTMSMTFDI